MQIDSDTGVLKVLANKAIDCDEPKRDDLQYEVWLLDGVHNTTGNVS